MARHFFPAFRAPFFVDHVDAVVARVDAEREPFVFSELQFPRVAEPRQLAITGRWGGIGSGCERGYENGEAARRREQHCAADARQATHVNGPRSRRFHLRPRPSFARRAARIAEIVAGATCILRRPRRGRRIDAPAKAASTTIPRT